MKPVPPRISKRIGFGDPLSARAGRARAEAPRAENRMKSWRLLDMGAHPIPAQRDQGYAESGEHTQSAVLSLMSSRNRKRRRYVGRGQDHESADHHQRAQQSCRRVFVCGGQLVAGALLGGEPLSVPGPGSRRPQQAAWYHMTFPRPGVTQARAIGSSSERAWGFPRMGRAKPRRDNASIDAPGRSRCLHGGPALLA
jgi:hypothetical protein